MNDLNGILREAGSRGLDMLWFPLLIWSVCALIVYLLLKFFKESDVLYQYHIRVALIAGIPLGILGSLSAPFLSGLFSGPGSTDSFAFIVVQNPIGAPIEPGAPLAVNWSDPNVWVGFFTLYLIFTSLLLGLQLIWSYIKVSSLADKFDLLSLRELKQFDYRQTNDNEDFVSSIAVSFSDEVSIPFTFGWKKPVIVIPGHLKGNPEKTELVIRHELTHIRHADYLLNALVLSVKSLFWFHPLVYLFDREIREYREIFCDTQVLADRSISPKKYAQLLFELAPDSHSGSSPALNMSVNKSTLLKRIQSIRILGTSRSFSKSRAVSLTLLTALSVFIACSDLQTSVASSVASSLNVEQTSLDGMFAFSGQEENGISSNLNEEPPPTPQQPPENSSSFQSASSTQRLTLQSNPPPPAAFVVVEEMPQLIGGLATLQQKIIYPQTALRAGIQGTVVVQFVVDEQGDVQNPRIIEGIGGGTGEESLRVISEAKFEPGRQRGRPVRVQYKIPFVFKLMEAETASDVNSLPNPSETNSSNLTNNI